MAMLLKVFGIAAMILGGLWLGQGTGLILWPANSFMLSEIVWTYVGSGLLVFGVVAFWRGSQRR